ncbi:MAG TPA: DUF892 family protein [Acidobacteriaceae bacterium]|nr:DUF892 family protein [Acidobacteriaceae bacterium]
MAKQFGESGYARLLEQTLEEEKETDAKLTALSEKVNPTAARATDWTKRVEGSAKKTSSRHAA